MAQRRRMTDEEIRANQAAARQRMNTASVAQRELANMERRGAAEGAVRAVPTDQEVAVEKAKDAGGETVPGQHHQFGADYRTVLGDNNTVHHVYGSGVDKSFRVDNENMADRRFLADHGQDYGQAKLQALGTGQQPNQSAFKAALGRLRTGQLNEAEQGQMQTAIGANPEAKAATMQALQHMQAQRAQSVQTGAQPPAGPTDTSGQEDAPRTAYGHAMNTVPAGRTPAEMRADNPAMVERVKRRMRGQGAVRAA